MAIRGIPLFDPRAAYIEDRREPPDTLFDESDCVPDKDPEFWDYHDGDDELDERGLHWWEKK